MCQVHHATQPFCGEGPDPGESSPPAEHLPTAPRLGGHGGWGQGQCCHISWGHRALEELMEKKNYVICISSILFNIPLSKTKSKVEGFVSTEKKYVMPFRISFSYQTHIWVQNVYRGLVGHKNPTIWRGHLIFFMRCRSCF